MLDSDASNTTIDDPIQLAFSLADPAGDANHDGRVQLAEVVDSVQFEPPSGGFQFRIGLEALVGKGLALSDSDRNPDKVGVLPWLYMSLGFSI